MSVKRYIEAHFVEMPSVGELARRAGVCPDHLTKQYFRHFGETPKEMIRRLQMDAAAKLLRETTLAVDRVGARIGMAAQSGFTKRFRQAFAVAPGEYRRRHLAGEAVQQTVPRPLSASGLSREVVAEQTAAGKSLREGRRFGRDELKMLYLTILDRQRHLRDMRPEEAAVAELRAQAGQLVQYPMQAQVEAFVVENQLVASLTADPRVGNVTRMAELTGLDRRRVGGVYRAANGGRGLEAERCGAQE